MSIDSYGSDVGWVVNNIGAHLWADDFGSIIVTDSNKIETV